MATNIQSSSIIERFAGLIIVQWGWRAALIAVLAGAVSALAMPPFDVFPVLFVTLPILVWLIDGTTAPVDAGFFRRLWPAARIGWLFGFGYFLAGLWWLGMAFLVDGDEFIWLLPIAVIALPAGLAMFWGFGAAIARIFWADGWRRIVALSAGLALAEWLRGTLFTGFPWNSIGYAAMTNPLMMQSASVLGLYGITPLALLVFSSPGIFAASSSMRPRRMRVVFVVVFALIFVHLGYGAWRLSTASNEMVANVKIRIIQPGIKQSEKWQEGKGMEVFNRYISLSARKDAATGSSKTLAGTKALDGITHLIWPESAFPFLLTRNRAAIASIAALLPQATTLITGAMRAEAPVPGASKGFTFNSLYVINGDGEIIQAQDKVHLVPFGEYLPFQSLLESIGLRQLTRLRGGFTAGHQRRHIKLDNAPTLLPLVCYEIIFPGQALGSGEKPGWIVNVTNDAWYGNTPGPYQHLRQARIRAIEEGLPLIRAANSGISVISDSYGRIIRSIPLGKIGIIDGPLPKAAAGTMFHIMGNLPYWLILFGFFFFLTLGKNRGRPKLH
jgi:apolipoprotein N-acyltransferase